MKASPHYFTNISKNKTKIQTCGYYQFLATPETFKSSLKKKTYIYQNNLLSYNNKTTCGGENILKFVYFCTSFLTFPTKTFADKKKPGQVSIQIFLKWRNNIFTFKTCLAT
jgi:hypothetical protein